MQLKTFRTVAASVVLVGLGLVALTQLGESGASSLALESPTSLATSEPAPTTTEKLTYRVGLLAAPSSDNYWEYMGAEATVWNTYVLGTTKPALYGVDPASNALTPDLAVTAPPTPVEDGAGWSVTVDLAAGESWSDGTPITAADLAYTFATVRRLGLGGGWAEAYPPEVVSIQAETSARARIRFSERPGLAVWPFGVGLAPLMPSQVWAPISDALDDGAALYRAEAAGDISGGPLRLVEVREERIEAEANPGRRGRFPDRVVYQVFPGEAEAAEALRMGDIDVVLGPHGLSPEALAALEDAPGVTLARSPANALRYLGFNLEREPMARPAFRTGLALLLDREAAVAELDPGADPAYTLLPPANRSWGDADRLAAIASPYQEPLAARLERALALLAEAGYAWETPPSVEGGELVAGSGLTIEGRTAAPLTILTPGDAYDPTRPRYAERVADTLAVLGFDARPVVTDFDTVVDLAFTQGEDGARQYDMYLLGWTMGNPALPDYHQALFSAEAPANSTGYSSPDFAALLSAYQDAGSGEEARRLLWDMEELLAGDLPYLPLYHPEMIEAYRSDRVGFGYQETLGGIQARLGGILDVVPGGSDPG